MNKVRRWRYYCDFCKKSGAAGWAMAQHEKHCTRNPRRVCRMCVIGGKPQQSLAEVIAVLRMGGLEAARERVHRCPACVLAAILQDRNGSAMSVDVYNFDFKAESRAFFNEANARVEREYIY